MKLYFLLSLVTCFGFAITERLFYEDFEHKSLSNSRWKVSGAFKTEEGQENILKYEGEWKIAESVILPGGKVEKGLVVDTPSKLHAISVPLLNPVNFQSDRDFVLQYEVKLNNSLQCGGAYIKLLSKQENFVPEKFDDKTPYTIMFGPDRCGSSQKVHFIFRHKNPLTGHYEEKHLKNPPNPIISQITNLYTLIVKQDNSYKILINKKEVKSGSLLTDFNPPVNPPKEIDDPDDFKPSNWVDEKMIPDANAKKPDNWDESEPFEIPDESASKPTDWLDEEPQFIPDPEAEMPDEWNEEDDGDWESPKIPNPKCEKVSGCGEWKKPMKANPAYKGKWYPPLIANPLYMGEWTPRKIANPNYFEDLQPSKLTSIGAIGFEIWTLQDGIIFDNILITDSIEEASMLADELWKPKHDYEESIQPKKKGSPGIFEEAWNEIIKILNEMASDPISSFRKYPLQLSVIFLTPLIILGIIGIALQPPKKVVKPEEKPQTEDDKKERERKGKDKIEE